MIRYIAFIRGINVGGKNIIKMDSLKNSFEAAGLKNVKTYIQSGNVIFDSNRTSLLNLRKHIEKQLTKDYGKEIKTVIRTIKQIEELVNLNPFKKIENLGDVKFYVLFLYEDILKSKTLPKVLEQDSSEILGFLPGEIFVASYPAKDGRYGFPSNLTEKKLGTFYTGRNWNTVCKILSQAKSGTH